jgi:CheY-like chemotaxis protein
MNKKILLVEDEKMIQDMYQMAFQQEGFTIEVAEDGQKAVEKLINQKLAFDLILLDLMMPKLDGISVLRKIKEVNSPAKDIPVFLLTNLGMDNIIKEGMSLGAEKFLVKANFLPKQVVDEVVSYFSSQKIEPPPTK